LTKLRGITIEKRIYSHQRRKGFGSFHSDDVEELIRLPEADYVAPDIYDRTRSELRQRNVMPQSYGNGGLSFGISAKLRHFVLDDSWTFINHGAFGGVLKFQLQEAELWRSQCESQPLRFFDRHLLPMIALTIRRVSTFLNCPAVELLPLPNVTTGLNSVINSIPLCKGDEVICLSLTYGSTKKILKDACDRSRADLSTINIPLNCIEKATVTELIVNSISRRTKMIILDQITSNTALVLPIIDIAAAIKAVNPNTIVIVDAAHGFFAMDCSIYRKEAINVESTQRQEIISTNLGSGSSAPSNKATTDTASAGTDINAAETATPPFEMISIADVADIWITNGHKWMCANKGCAFMWVSPRMMGKLRPAIISHGYSADESTGRQYADGARLLSSFIWDGCRFA
jgi:hypothetical protein